MYEILRLPWHSLLVNAVHVRIKNQMKELIFRLIDLNGKFQSVGGLCMTYQKVIEK